MKVTGSNLKLIGASMGCSPSNGANTKGNSTKQDKKNQGTVEIEQPGSGKKISLKFSLRKL